MDVEPVACVVRRGGDEAGGLAVADEAGTGAGVAYDVRSRARVKERAPGLVMADGAGMHDACMR